MAVAGQVTKGEPSLQGEKDRPLRHFEGYQGPAKTICPPLSRLRRQSRRACGSISRFVAQPGELNDVLWTRTIIAHIVVYRTRLTLVIRARVLTFVFVASPEVFRLLPVNRARGSLRTKWPVLRSILAILSNPHLRQACDHGPARQPE
jgi:hypothetical protein